MPELPIKIDRFIQLSVKEPLDKLQKAAWMASVKATAPSGVVATVQTVNDKGSLKSVCMVYKEGKNRHVYQIPLTRNLAPDEVEKIVDDFAARVDIDFDIETSESRMELSTRKGISLNDARHIELCIALAKSRHEKWIKDHLDSGWRFGLKVDTKEKTHPLLRPWDQLPDHFKQPNLDEPQAFFDLLDHQGYVIISKDELNRMKQVNEVLVESTLQNYMRAEIKEYANFVREDARIWGRTIPSTKSIPSFVNKHPTLWRLLK